MVPAGPPSQGAGRVQTSWAGDPKHQALRPYGVYQVRACRVLYSWSGSIHKVGYKSFGGLLREFKLVGASAGVLPWYVPVVGNIDSEGP